MHWEQVETRLAKPPGLRFFKNTVQFDAAVLLLLTREENPKILLTRRAAHLKSHAGEVSLPGGKKEHPERYPADTALRETWEEVGIPRESIRLIADLGVQKAKSGVRVRPVVGLIDAQPQLIIDSGEVAHAFWVPLQDLIQTPIKPHRINYRGMNLDTSAWHLQEEVIWGMTGRILSDFLNRIGVKNRFRLWWC